jgi:hypothetical protein
MVIDICKLLPFLRGVNNDIIIVTSNDLSGSFRSVPMIRDHVKFDDLVVSEITGRVTPFRHR